MSLVAPVFLLGLALLALPFWLHRLAHQRAPRRRFSSLMFMRPGNEQRLVRRQLRHPWILLMKLLAICVAVMAFAQPLVESNVMQPSVEGTTLQVVVIDASMSMGLGDRWQRARARVDDVLSEIELGDEVMLVSAGDRLEVLVAPGRNTVDIASAIARTTPGEGRLVFAGLLRRVASIARAVSESNASLHLHLVSDFQASGGAARFGELTAGEGVAFTLHDVAPSKVEDNWAIEQIRTSAGARRGGIEVVVKSFAAAGSERGLELRLDGEPVRSAQLYVPAAGRAAHEFVGIEAPRGDSRVEVRFESADSLSADDHRRAVIANRPAERVLVMTNASSGQDALYLQSALAASPALGFRAQQAAPDDWNELRFEDFPLVVLSDPSVLSAALTRQLARYVDAGGAALIFLGDEAKRNARVPLTGHVLRRPPTFGARDFESVAEADDSHPVSAGALQWEGVSFYDHLAIELQDGDRVLIRLEGGMPLLVEHDFGLGRVLIFTSALDREWSNLSMEPEFIPWILGAIRYLSGLRRTALEERVVGAPFNVSSAGVQLFDPDGEKVLSLAETLGGADVILEQVGFYEMKVAGQRRLIAVNPDPRESDPRGMEDALIERWQSSSPRATRSEPGELIEEEAQRALWPWFMALLLVLLIAESSAGNWLLRHRVTA